MRTSLKKYRSFSFALVAIVSLFLNAVCEAAPTAKNSLENSRIVNSPFIQNPVEALEETSLQTSSFDSREIDFSFRHPSPNRLFKRDRNFITFGYKESLPKFSFVSYDPLLRPAYYHFLSRHNLF